MAEPFVHVMEMLSNVKNWELQDEIANVAARSSEAATTEGVATIAGPAMVFFAMLVGMKHDYQAVADLVADKNTATGMSQGMMMGLLGWKWRQVDDRFARHYVLQIYEREDLNDIRVISYNFGLRLGYHVAATYPSNIRQGYLKACRRLSGATPGQWTERDQINYVIDMAVAFRRQFMTI